MVKRAEVTDSLRGPAKGTRRFSRHRRPPVSRVGSLAFVFGLWMLIFTLAPMLIGWWPTVIGSGSMAPGMRAGDAAIIAPHTGADLAPGSVIVFQSDSARAPTIHRIVGVTPDGAYITKGDANAGIDSSEVRPYQVKGVARLLVPYVGLPAHWLRIRHWEGLAGFAGVVILAGWLANWRPRRDRELVTVNPGRRWAAAGAMSVVLVGAVGATTMGAFTDPTGTASNVLASGSWFGLSVAGGEEHSCAAMDDGGAYCWGANKQGQLGDGTKVQRSTATRVVGPGGTGYLSGVVSIAAGPAHTCAVLGDGSAYCWGANKKGQLGDGTKDKSLTPVQVLGIGGTGSLAGVLEIEAGKEHTCARLSDGTAVCWGDNKKGQLGDATKKQRLWPVKVRAASGGGDLAGVVDLGLGEVHSCAALTNGDAYCWGEGGDHRLGNGSEKDRLRPVQVKGPAGSGNLGDVVSISGGKNYSCAGTRNGSAYCWGRNDDGNLGIGSTSDTTYPVQVLGRGGSGYLSGVSAVSLGEGHSCALHIDGTASCWGLNDKGQLGDGTTTDRSSPVQVVGSGGSGTFADASALGSGYSHTVVLRSGIEGWAWGRNKKSQLGDGTTADSASPVQVSGL